MVGYVLLAIVCIYLLHPCVTTSSLLLLSLVTVIVDPGIEPRTAAAVTSSVLPARF